MSSQSPRDPKPGWRSLPWGIVVVLVAAWLVIRLVSGAGAVAVSFVVPLGALALIAVTVAVFGKTALGMFAFVKSSKEDPSLAKVQAVVDDCCIRMGLTERPIVRSLDSPALNAMALTRRMLLVTTGLEAGLSDDALRYVVTNVLAKMPDEADPMADTVAGSAGIRKGEAGFDYETHVRLAIAADEETLRLLMDPEQARIALERVLLADHHLGAPGIMSLNCFAWPGEGGEQEYADRLSALKLTAGAEAAGW